jgi:hypothetical protein
MTHFNTFDNTPLPYRTAENSCRYDDRLQCTLISSLDIMMIYSSIQLLLWNALLSLKYISLFFSLMFFFVKSIVILFSFKNDINQPINRVFCYYSIR